METSAMVADEEEKEEDDGPSEKIENLIVPLCAATDCNVQHGIRPGD